MKEIYIDFNIVANMIQATSHANNPTSWVYYCHDIDFMAWMEKLGKQVHENYNKIDKEFMKKYDCDVIYLQWMFSRMQSYVHQAMVEEQELFSKILDDYGDEDREPLPNEYLWGRLEELIDTLDELQ